MASVRIITIVASLGVLSVSAFTVWLAARWTSNKGLKAFALFLFGLIGIGLTAFLPGDGNESKSLLKPLSYVFETTCLFFIPYFVYGIIERPIPVWFRTLYAAFCAAALAMKVLIALLFLTQLAQTIIAIVDTAIVISFLAFLAVSLKQIRDELTRRLVGRFTVATFVFIPILFYNVIGIPGFNRRFDPFITDACFFFAVSLIIIAESKSWLAELASKQGAAAPSAIQRNEAVLEAEDDDEKGEVARIYAELSARQREIARMILEGNSAKDIAVRLGISPKTAENHTYALYRKFGARSRIQFYELMRDVADATPPRH